MNVDETFAISDFSSVRRPATTCSWNGAGCVLLMIKVDVSSLWKHQKNVSITVSRRGKHRRLVVLCELFSLFIFTESRRTLAERTVAKHLCAGTGQRQVCCRLVLCTEKKNKENMLTLARSCTRPCTDARGKKPPHTLTVTPRETHGSTVFSRCSTRRLFNWDTDRCEPDRARARAMHTFRPLLACLGARRLERTQ